MSDDLAKLIALAIALPIGFIVIAFLARHDAHDDQRGFDVIVKEKRRD